MQQPKLTSFEHENKMVQEPVVMTQDKIPKDDDKTFNEHYEEGKPPWDIGGPQPAIVKLFEKEKIKGRVLDVGCGTGEHVLFFAEKGFEVWGVDAATRAIEQAEDKARKRSIQAQFKVADALKLQDLNQSFNTIIDSGLFHVFSDEDRPRFVESLKSVLVPGGNYFMLCFSEKEPGDWGPRRVTQEEIQNCFSKGWKIVSITESHFDTHLEQGRVFAWLSEITRL